MHPSRGRAQERGPDPREIGIQTTVLLEERDRQSETERERLKRDELREKDEERERKH